MEEFVVGFMSEDPEGLTPIDIVAECQESQTGRHLYEGVIIEGADRCYYCGHGKEPQKEQETTPDYSKGCARYKKITCDCDLMANECKGKDFEIASLRQQLQEKDEIIQYHIKGGQSLGEELKKLTADLENNIQQRDNLTAEINKAKEQNAELRGELEEKVADLNECTNHIGRLQGIVSKQSAEIAELKVREKERDEIKLSHAIEAMESYSQTELDKAWNKAIAQAIYLIENRGTWAELVEELQKLRK